MKRARKPISLILSSLLCIGLLSACGDSPANSSPTPTPTATVSSGEPSATAPEASDGFYVSEAEGGKTTDQFTIWAGWTSDAADDTVVQRVMKEELGIDYKVEFMQTDDTFSIVSMRLASGDALPDMMLFWRNQEIERLLIESNRVMKLNDVYESSKLTSIPNIDDRIQQVLRQSNGDIYTIPGWYDQNYDDPWPGWTVDAWWVNTQMMEEANVTEADLSTIEGMEDAMRKFAQLKDSTGKSVIPLTSIWSNGTYQERLLLAAFGVDATGSTSGMAEAMEINGEFVFKYDNPNYKAAFQWINKMYREGLVDLEVATQQSERYKEKIRSGQVAMFISDMWQASAWNAGYEADSPGYQFRPFQSPKVSGIEKATTSYVNPNPTAMVLVNKDTDHLNAVLNFLEWCNEPNPLRQQEVNEGPVGVNWYLLEDGTHWKFNAEYDAERNSGDTARKGACTPELWQLASFSKEWYPWWTNTSDVVSNAPNLGEYCATIAETIHNHRVIENRDLVKLDTESLFASNQEALSAVSKEYQAKMLMAKSEAEFEKIYNTFMEQLETRANWSALKEEWLKAYQAQFGK